MKLKKLAKCSLATALIFGSVGAISGCNKDNDTTEKTEQEETYNLYVQYMSAKGETPLTYEQWLASIKGEKGEDGISPKVRINETTNYWEISIDDGVTWTSTGVKATGAEGEKGDPGDDAIAPQVRINQTTNYWEISTDNGVTWTSTGVKATGAEGNNGHTPVITIGQNGNWYIDGVDSGKPSKGEDASFNTYQVLYEYSVIGNKEIFENYKDSQSVKTNEWIIEMPKPKDAYINDFDGWYIKGTNIKIENYDFIGGNVTLVDKWNKYPIAPSGIYQNNERVMTWDEIVEQYPSEYIKDGELGDRTERVIYPILNGDLIIDSSITKINDYAFYGSNIVNIVIPSSVEQIGENSVNNSGVYNLVERAFRAWSSLENIIVSEDNQNYSSEDGVIFNKDKSNLLYYPLAKEDLSYSIPESVETVVANGFSKTKYLENLTISENVSSFGVYNVGSIKNIIVDVENEYYSSEGGILFNKDKTVLILYPSGKTETTYSIPSSVNTIKSGAFPYKHKLKTINISTGVINIEDNAFVMDDTNLENFVVDAENEYYSSEDGVLFNKDKTTLIKYPAGKTNNSYTIPSHVTTIKEDAFSDCEHLYEVVIGSNVNVVGDGIFAWSFNIETLIIDTENLTNDLLVSLEPNTPGLSGSTSPLTTLYIKESISVENFEYLEENFTKQATSDKAGYDMYVRNAE